MYMRGYPKNGVTSLPMRERGLKYSERTPSLKLYESLPMRERGLKSKQTQGFSINFYVAPHAGAWIEIIFSAGIYPLPKESLPMRERGLKYSMRYSYFSPPVGRSPCGSVD